MQATSTIEEPKQGWTPEEESIIARIMSDESMGRLEAICKMRSCPTARELVAQKEQWGFLRGSDAEQFMDYVESASKEKWTKEAEQELTTFMLGLPTKPGYRFEVIAGAPITPAAVIPMEPGESRERTCLGCGRKFTARRKHQEFHNDSCHTKAGVRQQQRGSLPTDWKLCAVCAMPFKPERANEKYCPQPACNRQGARKAAKQVEMAGVA